MGVFQASGAIQHHALVCENVQHGDFCSENRISVSVPVLKQAQTQTCIAKGMLNYFKQLYIWINFWVLRFYFSCVSSPSQALFISERLWPSRMLCLGHTSLSLSTCSSLRFPQSRSPNPSASSGRERGCAQGHGAAVLGTANAAQEIIHHL